MRRLVLLLATVGAMLILYTGAASAEAAPGETLDANSLASAPPQTPLAVANFFEAGQTFTAEHDGTLTSIEIWLARQSVNVTEDLTVQIVKVDANSGLPTAPEDVLATAKLPASEVAETWQSVNDLQKEKITFDTPASVVAGEKYALLLKVGGPPVYLNSYVVGGGPQNSDIYAGGDRIFRQSQLDPANTFGPWKRDDQPFDLIFGIYVTTSEDTTPPKVESTVPKANANEVAPTANIRATFSEDMQSASVKNAFKLFKKGSTTQIAAQVSYDTTTDIATLNSNNNLRRGVAYKAVVTTVAKDKAGNRLDQDDSTAGLQQKVWYFTVDN